MGRDFLDPDHLGRIAFRRPARATGAPRIYISTGIHGDELAGPLTALRLLEENRWPDAHLWLLPCPRTVSGPGPAPTREGIDLNGTTVISGSNPGHVEMAGAPARIRPHAVAP